jgi:sigma-B regulation protein RsbU (phosphoserine phosphatase)
MFKILRTTILSIIFISFCTGLHAAIDTLSLKNFKDGIDLEGTWRYKKGDSLTWAAADYNDSSWTDLKNDKLNLRDSAAYHGISWFRTTFFVDSLLQGMPLAFQVRVLGALDIFVDGKLISSIGKVGATEKDEKSGFSTRWTIIPLSVISAGPHKVAIRGSNFVLKGNLGIINISGTKFFEVLINSMKEAIVELEDITTIIIPVFFAGVFVVLSLFHFILFLFYRRNRANLYYSIFTFFLFCIFFAVYTVLNGTNVESTKWLLQLIMVSLFFVPLFFLGMLYEIFYGRLIKRFWIMTGALIIGHVLFFLADQQSVGFVVMFGFAVGAAIETIRIIIRSVMKKRDGALVFLFGLIFPIIGAISFGIISKIFEKAGMHRASEFLSDHLLEFIGYSALMSVSISMTIYLGRDFAKINRKMREQIFEIKTLFERTIDQEKERKKILENQKEELETTVRLRTEEVVRQKAELELKNKDILDNLLYAKRIQDAILPEIKLIYKTLRDSFILYWPKDIVSGDFYSFSQRDGKVIISAADCTGHGVTGAFMSMIGSSVLNQIINERGITFPAQILQQLNTGIADALRQSQSVNDGMDISICTFDLNKRTLQFAGANRPLWIIRDGNFQIVKPDKTAIGGVHIQHETNFTNHEFVLHPDDAIYLFTDGFADQFGGPDGKKLLSKRFREMLLKIYKMPMNEQETILTAFFNDWKGSEVQVDDVLVIGIRI